VERIVGVLRKEPHQRIESPGVLRQPSLPSLSCLFVVPFVLPFVVPCVPSVVQRQTQIL
jgi:hypothetical protein